jgi:small subunit ribosomal protein S17
MADKTTESTRGKRVEVIGDVVSDKMDKTVSVRVYRQVRHGRYGKFLRRTSVYKAHDESNQAKVGDTVLIVESRPYSKTKCWKLSKILGHKAVREDLV